MNTSTALPRAPLLALHDVHVRYPIGRDLLGRSKGYAHALNGIDLDIREGETLGIVGESGCGKSTLAQLLMGLLKPGSGSLESIWNSPEERTHNTQIVFQDPQSSLNPRLPVWRIVTEPLVVQEKLSTLRLREIAAWLAEQVGLRPEYMDRYPHQFSGGQRQRIAIARALSSDPDVIVLDEPTSALDISVQAQILNLLVKLQRERSLTYILISHNVSVVRHLCDRVAVMYLGQIVEIGETAAVLEQSAHPYTRLLLDAVPRLGKPLEGEAAAQRTDLPSNRTLPTGCFFKERCESAAQGCERPQHLQGDQSSAVRCHLASSHGQSSL